MLHAIHAERASSNAMVASPLSAATTSSIHSDTHPRHVATASATINAARARSAAIITRSVDTRSTRTPSSSAPAAPATTSAIASRPICNGVAASVSVAIQGITRRVSIEPKFETTSAASTRRKGRTSFLSAP
jgi:hypothetical protein